MPEYVLLLCGGQPAPDASAEDYQRMLKEYQNWMATVLGDKMTGGLKLKDDGVRRMHKAESGDIVTDGPFPETKETIGGFFHIKADSYEHAATLAATCPIFLSNGTIELRQVDKMGS